MSEKPTTKYRFERISEDRIRDIVPVFNALFRKKFTEKYLRKKYNTAYCGLSHVCYMAYDEEGKAVAFYGSLPYRFLYKDREIHIVEACDSLTLPEHQKKGLHFQLANLSYEFMRQHQVLFVFALHSATTFQHTKRLQWESLEHLHRYHIRPLTLPLNKLLFRMPSLHRNYTRWVKKSWKKYISEEGWFENPLHTEGFLSVRYSPEFFQYKQAGGSFLLEICGKKIWVKIEGALLVGAVEYCDLTTFKAMLLQLKHLCRRVGISEILFQISPGTHLDEMLSTFYPALQSWLVGYLNFSSDIPFDALKFNYGDLDSF
jgi:hypothetical protein